MRYNEVVEYLQNLTKRDVKPYDMTKALGGNISKYTYRRDNNGNFSKDEIKTLIDYFRGTEFIPNLNQDNENILLDYYPEVFGSCGGGVFELSQEKELIAVPKNKHLKSDEKCSFIVIDKFKQEPYLFKNKKCSELYDKDPLGILEEKQVGKYKVKSWKVVK